jgi:non-lysosomal glucosylceramidase
MNEIAWKTIEGMYNLCYNRMGLAFQMPEAILKSNKFRSLSYMRPLCIWAIQYAIEKKNREKLFTLRV